MTGATVESWWRRGDAEGWSDIEHAVAAATDHLGKPVVVREESFLATEPVCGFVATLQHQHLVMISPTTSETFRSFVIGHELGHLLHRHQDHAPQSAYVRDVIPDVPEYKVERALARGAFSNDYEHEAELFADRLAALIRRHRGRPSAFRGVFG
ncbi:MULTISPECIES: ImmA/IrrE family metallo-endopeptidase [unclassified Curtobacterium]|uniref:ImmA/IrrE family metallo-endopeptidase n=1 Tax=unclassified Curtobacterium TaxID=257496 RepID=UPI0008246F85|nr:MULTISPECIES: ImmA/IrrE family metallo-endopeptidase [unclassified Curtobacterium]WIA95608.1 ImmA/IrrE family metallo-endopeptidase [Curtobacterium sp. MCBA15_004]WIA98974.1 ImmA/IrrE family metallo-endopeptidase [Curtobacterium sp. MCBA15_012]